MREGYGIIKTTEGNEYDGRFKYDKKEDGYAVLKFANGLYYEG